MDINALIDQAVSDAQVIFGEKVGVIANPRSLPSQKTNSCNRARPWTQAEDEYYLANSGHMSYEEIAQHLGRSYAAIKCHFNRKGFPAATKNGGYITAQRMAEVLSIDPHKTVRWIREGILPGERMFFTGREIHRTSIIRFKMWLTKPESWIYFDATRIKNAALRSLVLRAQSRWGDEWWTTKQAGDYLGVDVKDITRQIDIGKIRGIQAKFKGGRDKNTWSFWYVRKSEAVMLHIPRGKGGNKREYHWPAGADRFLIDARSKGVQWDVIGRMMKWSEKRCQYRFRLLTKESGERG